jgi:hypothetical protein
VGVLLLLQAVMAVPVYTEIGMMRAVIGPGFLANAAQSAMQIRVGALLTLVLSALAVAAALVALPLFRRHSQRMAHLFLALCVIGVAMQAIESVAIRDMVTMSVMYAKAGAQKAVLETLGAVARSTWSSAHFQNLMLGHIKAFTFFVILYRFALVPRALTGAGIAATLLSMTAATMSLLGQPFSYLMIMPAGLTQLALTLWLMVRGFAPAPER